MTRELLAALVIASAALTASAPAFAAQETPRIALKTSDLDLSTVDGQRVARERIDVVAKSACTAVNVGSRFGRVDTDCQKDVTRRLTDALNKQQARKSAPVQSAGAAATPKAVDQPEH